MTDKLTAQQVCELMETHSHQYPSPTDPYVWITEYDWQAIADELNATLGRGECEVEYSSDWFGWHCKSCDVLFMGLESQPPTFCPRCGAKVVTS